MTEELRVDNGLMKVKELAKYLNYDIQTIYRMVKAGTIPHFRVPGKSSLRFSKEQIDNWLEKATEPQTSTGKS